MSGEEPKRAFFEDICSFHPRQDMMEDKTKRKKRSQIGLGIGFEMTRATLIITPFWNHISSMKQQSMLKCT